RDRDAATLLGAGAVEQREGVTGRRFGPDAWAEIAAPLTAGVITDTDSFRSPGADLDALRMCKDLLTRRLGGDLESVQARLHYEFPEAGVQALASGTRGEGATGVRERRLSSAGEMLLSVPRGAFVNAFEAARSANDKTAESDVTGHLLDRLDGVMARSEVGILAVEGPAGVQVSVRSQSPDVARQLVEELFPGRGGGKPHAAAARPEGSLPEVERQLEGWFRRRELQRELKLRAGAF
ncbi:MAG: DHHA1 domain-containing protein, partial [Myxococcota bacterium]